MAILQGTDSPAEYLFTNLLFKGFALTVPSIRIIEYSDPEYKLMIISITTRVNSLSLKSRLEKYILEKPYILIYEYIPHLNMIDINQTKAISLFKYETGERSRSIFINFGKVIGLDIISNSDCKIPFIFNHTGYPSLIGLNINLKTLTPYYDFKNDKDSSTNNLFFSDRIVISLFNKCNSYNNANDIKLLSDYCNSISDVLNELLYEIKSVIFYGLDVNNFTFKSMIYVTKFFKSTCNYDLLSKNCFHIATGLLLMLYDYSNIDIKTLEELINYIKNNSIYKDYGDYYKRSIFKLNISYFRSIKKCISEIFEKNKTIINWLKDSTLNLYNLSNFLLDKNNVLKKNYNKASSINLSIKKSSSSLTKNENEDNLLLFSKKNNRINNKVKNQVNIIENMSKLKNEIHTNNSTIKKSEDNIKTSLINYLSRPNISKTALYFYNNLKYAINCYNKLKYSPECNVKSNNNTNEIKKISQKNYDDFNENKPDFEKYINDVHNGLYDVVDIEIGDGRQFILEWKDLNLHPGIDTKISVKDIKSNKIEYEENNKPLNIKDDINLDHKKYTMEELKQLITKKELKSTLNIKEELNPEEGNILKNKLNVIDPELLEGTEYKGKSLGRSAVINKEMDNRLAKTLVEFEQNALTKKELEELLLEKEKNVYNKIQDIDKTQNNNT